MPPQRVSFRLQQTNSSSVTQQHDTVSLSTPVKSNRKDESWRKHGKNLRKQLILQDEQQGNRFSISNHCAIERYYQVADKVLDQFLHHQIDTKEELLEAYLVGTRLQKFLSLVLPTHQDYFSNDPLRERSQEQLVELMQYLEPMARMIDEQEHEAFISRVILEDNANNTSAEEESKVQQTIFSLETNSILASEDSGSTERPVVVPKNSVVAFGESKEPSVDGASWEEAVPLRRGRRGRPRVSTSKRDDRVIDPYQKQKLDDDNDTGRSRHERSGSRDSMMYSPEAQWDSQDSIYPQQANRGSSDSHGSSESRTIQWRDKDPTFSIPQQSRRRLGSKESQNRTSPTMSVQWDDESSKQSNSKHQSSRQRRESRDHHVIDPYESQKTQWEEEKSGRSTPSSSSSSGRRGSSKSSRNRLPIDRNDEKSWYDTPVESAASASRKAQPASPFDDSSYDRGSNYSGRSGWNDESVASQSSRHTRKASDSSDVRSSIDPNNTDEIQWDEDSASYVLKQPRSRQRHERKDSRGYHSPMDPYEASRIDWDEESATSPPAKQSSSRTISERPPLRPPSQVRRFEEQDRQWDDVLSLDPSSKKESLSRSSRRGKKDDSLYTTSEWSSQSSEVSSQWTKTNVSVASSRFEESRRSAGKKSSKKLNAVTESFDPWTTGIYSQREEEKDSISMMQPLESKIEKRLSRLEQKLEKRQARTSNDKFFESLDGESPTSVHEFQDWMSSPSTERYSRARDGRIRLRDDDSLRLVDEEEEESIEGKRKGRLQPFRNCVKCLLE